MEKRKKALLIGLVLGDGHLNPNSGVALEISHCGNQLFYLEYKAKLINSLIGGKYPKIHKRKDREEYKISKGHRYFKILYKWLYPNGVKTFTRKMLNYLTPEAIALWWMDDGSHGIDRNKTTGKITSHSFHFYTYVDEEQTQIIIDYFKEVWNINFYKIKRTKKDGTLHYYLKCRTKEGRKFCDLIRPYILPGFEYKIMQPHE